MNGIEQNIGSFFAEVEIIFNFDEQLNKLQEQLRSFADRVGAITIPVRLVGLNDASLEMASMRGMGFGPGVSYSGRRPNGLTEAQWETQTNQSMRAQGYSQGEGGWYKPAAEESAGAMGAIGGGSNLLGFAKTNAVFFAAFAAIGDLMKGAQLDRQLAVLQNIIPNQQQYNKTLSQLAQTANLTGTSIDKTVHGFIAFSNAAVSAGIDMDTAQQSFRSLNIAIGATNNQQQAYRIYQDFIASILNPDKVSFAKISHNDLNTHLGLVKLLMNLPQFKGKDEKQLSSAFDQLTKSQQLNLISTVLNTKFQDQAAAAMDTVAGRWFILNNDLEILGATLTDTLGPSLKLIIDSFTVLTTGVTYALTELNQLSTYFKELKNIATGKTIIPAGGINTHALKGLAYLQGIDFSGKMAILTAKEKSFLDYITPNSYKNIPKNTSIIIQDKTSAGIKASVSHAPSQMSRQVARSH